MNQELLDTVIAALSQTVDLLYQEKLQLAYRQLVIVLPQLEQIIGQLEDETEQMDFLEKLQSALAAMEEGDCTLLADIIAYELLEKLNNMKEE